MKKVFNIVALLDCLAVLFDAFDALNESDYVILTKL
jgi:hypothetical protein